MALISCLDAAFAYEGNNAVSGLNFEIHSGDYLCIVGENGSGKSTLLRGLLRLKQPVKGRVLMGDGIMANEIGYLPQQAAIQKDFPASAYEVVISGRLGRRGFRPYYSREDKAAAKENMNRLDIWTLRDKCYRELSGGQQRRILLARAFCAARKMLFLDEPVTGLDPVMTQYLYRQIYKINRETGITVVMISHDICSAVRYATHILHLKNTQVFFGTTAEYAKSGVGAGFLGSCLPDGLYGDADGGERGA